jgi:hypothetical protein
MHKHLLNCFYLLLFPLIAICQEQEVDSTKSSWAFSASAYYYIVPSEKNTASIIGYADHNSLHFEARYNYEDHKTGSAFAGWRFETGNKFVFGATPMAGLVFGNTNGIGPGLELDASYGRFDYYSETEYIIDFDGKENNFLYTWGELGISAFSRFRTGLSYQRTKLYQSSFEVQRGIFAEYQIWKFTIGAYYFDPFSNSAYVIASLSFDF